MKVVPYKTEKVVLGGRSLLEILDDCLPPLEEGSIVVVTSKIVSICEGSVVPKGSIDKEELVLQQADLVLPAQFSKYGHHFTVIDNTLISMAGIDESNGEGYYILWPKDTQATANVIREHLVQKHGLRNVGVIITDSTCQPLRRGTVGIAMAHSGFAAVRNYIGKPDLFGRPFDVTHSNIANGLAAGAVVTMGEGAEQTPLAVISEVPFVDFESRNPTSEEITEAYIPLEDDLFEPFLTAVDWQKGQSRSGPVA